MMPFTLFLSFLLLFTYTIFPIEAERLIVTYKTASDTRKAKERITSLYTVNAVNITVEFKYLLRGFAVEGLSMEEVWTSNLQNIEDVFEDTLRFTRGFTLAMQNIVGNDANGGSSIVSSVDRPNWGLERIYEANRITDPMFGYNPDYRGENIDGTYRRRKKERKQSQQTEASSFLVSTYVFFTTSILSISITLCN
jgi:hypothetical protein